MDSARLYRKSGAPNADFEKSNWQPHFVFLAAAQFADVALSLRCRCRSIGGFLLARPAMSRPLPNPRPTCHASPVAMPLPLPNPRPISALLLALSLSIRDSAGDQVAITSLFSRLSVIIFATALDEQLNTPIRLWIAD
ncbi:hypothetical protein ACLOJK_035979 [Asimina triloba]